MTTVVPLISSSVVGPLGVRHLPRLWLKLLLHACGRLPDGYRHGVGGFDETLCDALGIDRDALVAFVAAERPTYLATEAWVRAHAANLTPAAIAAFNDVVATRELPDAMRPERFARIGLSAPSEVRAVPLNDLDDWTLVHEQLVANRD